MTSPVHEKSAPAVRARALAALVVAAASLSVGCFPSTFNVRADKAFANEPPVADVVRDRAADIEKLRASWVELLTKTPYAPGDAWIESIGMAGEVAERARREAQASPTYVDGEHEIPVATLYRLHLDKVRVGAKNPRKFEPTHPSVLDALASLLPEKADISAAFVAYEASLAAVAERRTTVARTLADLRARKVRMPPEVPAEPPELVSARDELARAEAARTTAAGALGAVFEGLARADLSDPVRDRIARDGLAVLSVALRSTLESLAIVSVVVKQSAQAVESAQRDLFSTNRGGEARELGLEEIPARMAFVELRGTGDEAWLERANEALGASLRVSQGKTPGFLYRESLVDQVASIKWDSFRGHAKLDGEIVFYNQLGAGGISGDYTGRTRRLAYDVSPVAMVGGRVQLAYDWIHVKNAATLGGAFTTDRLFGAGGDIQTSGSLGERLGLSGFASEVVDIGAGLLGVRTRYKNATFTSGEVTEVAVDPVTGADRGQVGKARLQLAYTQLDIAYDVAFLLPPETIGRYWIEEVIVGFRYMNYRMPRIVYELRDVNPPGSEGQNFRFDRESLAQKVTTESYMGGGTFRFGQGEARRVSLFGDVGVYGGAGPLAYTFANGNVEKPTALVLNGSLGLGARIRLTTPRSRFRVLVEAQYHGEGIYQTVISELRATETVDGTTYQVGKKVDFGAFDLFHGPRLQLVGVF